MELLTSLLPDVTSRGRSSKTKKLAANKCKLCWGKKEVIFYKSGPYPIFVQGMAHGRKIYNVNPETVSCRCQRD